MDQTVIVAQVDLQQIDRSVVAAFIAVQDGDRALDAAERKTEGLREQQRRNRVELGRTLIEARKSIKRGTWIAKLEEWGIDRFRAHEWMRLAGYVEEQEKCAASPDVEHLNAKLPTLADVGIDKRPRKRDEQPDPSLDWQQEVESRRRASNIKSLAIDVDQELSRWHQKIVAFAEACSTTARKQIAHELRQMANTIETIKE
jgi:hypothetical protein